MTDFKPGQAVTVHSTNGDKGGPGRRIGVGVVREITPSGVIVRYTTTARVLRVAVFHPTLVKAV